MCLSFKVSKGLCGLAFCPPALLVSILSIRILSLIMFLLSRNIHRKRSYDSIVFKARPMMGLSQGNKLSFQNLFVGFLKVGYPLSRDTIFLFLAALDMLKME